MAGFRMAPAALLWHPMAPLHPALGSGARLQLLPLPARDLAWSYICGCACLSSAGAGKPQLEEPHREPGAAAHRGSQFPPALAQLWVAGSSTHCLVSAPKQDIRPQQELVRVHQRRGEHQLMQSRLQTTPQP